VALNQSSPGALKALVFNAASRIWNIGTTIYRVWKCLTTGPQPRYSLLQKKISISYVYNLVAAQMKKDGMTILVVIKAKVLK
jgi:hypothetical protein